MICGFKDHFNNSIPNLINSRSWKHNESIPIPGGRKINFSFGPEYSLKKERKDKDSYSFRKRFKKATACGSPPTRKKFCPGSKGFSPSDTLYHYSADNGPRLDGLPMFFHGLTHQQSADCMLNDWYDNNTVYDSNIIERKFDLDIYGMDKIDQLAINLPHVMNEAIGLISRSLNWEANQDMIGVAIQTETLRILRGDFLYSHLLPFFLKLERVLRKMSCSESNIFSEAIRKAHIDITRQIRSMKGLKKFSRYAFSNFFRDFPWIATCSKSMQDLNKWGDKSLTVLNHSVDQPKEADSARKEIRDLKQQLRAQHDSASKWKRQSILDKEINSTLRIDLATTKNELGQLKVVTDLEQDVLIRTIASDKSQPIISTEGLEEAKRAYQATIDSLQSRIDPKIYNLKQKRQ